MKEKFASTISLVFLSLGFLFFLTKFSSQQGMVWAQSCQDGDEVCPEDCSFEQDNDCLVIEIGEKETVFDWSGENCENNDIPDSPARAFVDADGNLQLISTHYTARRKIGPNLDDVNHQCAVIFRSDYDREPRNYNDHEWLVSPYTLDGTNIYALLHTEYQGWRYKCFAPEPRTTNCWWNSINLAYSTDKGQSYAHASPPEHNIANSPSDYDPYNNQGHIGFFEPSNIVSKDGYYYALSYFHNPPQTGHPETIMRTNDLSDPKSWRFWDGSDFTLKGYEGPNPRSYPVSGDSLHFQVSNNTYLEKYISVGCWDWNNGIEYSTSDDLIHWTDRKILSGGAGPYASLLQPGDPTRNFEQTGRSPWLYYVRCNKRSGSDCITLDRDLKRVRIRFSKPEDVGRYEILDLQMNEKTGNKTLDSSFYGNNGNLSGLVNFINGWVDPSGRNSLHFEDGEVRVAHDGSLNLGNEMAIEAWVRIDPASLGGFFPVIVTKEGSCDSRNFGLFIDPSSGKLHFSLSKDGLCNGSVGATSIADGQWHHIALTYQDSTGKARYYVDGYLDAERTHDAYLGEGQNTYEVVIGRNLVGEIDSLTIYNYAKDYDCGNGIMDPDEACELDEHFCPASDTSCHLQWWCNPGGSFRRCNSDCSGYHQSGLCSLLCGADGQCDHQGPGEYWEEGRGHDWCDFSCQYHSSSPFVSYYFREGPGSQNTDSDTIVEQGNLKAELFNTQWIEGGSDGSYLLEFNGINSYVQMPNNPIFNLDTEVSLKVRVKLKYPPTNNSILLAGKGDSYWLEFYRGGNLCFWIKEGDGYHNVCGPLNLNQWYSIRATYNGSQLNLYKDGSLVNSTATSGLGLIPSTELFQLSNKAPSPSGYNDPFDGLLDYVKVYSFAAPPQEGDLNDDHLINFQDFKFLIENWGSNPSLSAADLSGDSKVNGLDFGKILKLIS